MSYEINVSVFPPAGAGVMQVPDGKGGFSILPAPAVEYKNVDQPEPVYADNGAVSGIKFKLRGGDIIETNLGTIVRYIKKTDDES